MRLLKTLLVTVLVVGLAGAAAYGTGVLTAQPSWRAAEAPREPAEEPASAVEPATDEADRDEPLPDAVPAASRASRAARCSPPATAA